MRIGQPRTQSRAAFDQLAERWQQRYPAIIKLWDNAWDEFIPFLDYDVEIRKVTGLPVPAGSVVRIRCGGGGGYGPPLERDVAAVKRDLQLGVVSEEAARRDYPQAFR